MLFFPQRLGLLFLIMSLQGRLFNNNSLFHHCENADKKGPLGVVMMVIMTRLKENYEDWRKKDD